MGATHYLLLAAVAGYEHLESQAIDIVPGNGVNVSLEDLQPECDTLRIFDEKFPQRGERVGAARRFTKDILSDPSARGMKKSSNLMMGDIFFGWSDGQAQADESQEQGVVWP